jgi:hypothetical protein
MLSLHHTVRALARLHRSSSSLLAPPLQRACHAGVATAGAARSGAGEAYMAAEGAFALQSLKRVTMPLKGLPQALPVTTPDRTFLGGADGGLLV